MRRGPDMRRGITGTLVGLPVLGEAVDPELERYAREIAGEEVTAVVPRGRLRKVGGFLIGMGIVFVAVTAFALVHPIAEFVVRAGERLAELL
jgi:hypothetical protein